METQVRTPQLVFVQPQRLVVPLFQRPYVWNEDSQWEPLWNDFVRVADRLLKEPQDKHRPHFLGAMVLQQVQNPDRTHADSHYHRRPTATDNTSTAARRLTRRASVGAGNCSCGAYRTAREECGPVLLETRRSFQGLADESGPSRLCLECLT